MTAYEILQNRGVTRLCHFTKLQSFTHIITSENGILANSSIRQDTKNATDRARYDSELNYVCCSVEYPNSWFLNKAIQRNTDQIFTEWIVLYIDISILNNRNAKFCPCNASRSNGAHIVNNINNVNDIFQKSLPTFKHQRTNNMLTCCPTDGQAEILIKDNIPRSYIKGIAVGNEEVAKSIYSILKLYYPNSIPIYISPDVLTTKWSELVRNGKRPNENEFTLSEEE